MEKYGRRRTIIDIALILGVGLLSLTWFRGDNIINVGDFCFPLSRKLFFQFSLFVWDHSISMGYPATGQLAAIFPYSFFGWLTEVLGLSLVFFEKAIFYFWFSASGIGMYALCRQLKFPRIAVLFSALFYMMNPYSLLVPWHLASGQLISGYVMTPVLLMLFIRALDFRQYSDALLMIAVWFFAGTYAYMNPTVALVHLTILLSYLAYHFWIRLSSGRGISKDISQSLIIFSGWFLLSLYWVAPFILNMTNQLASAANPNMGFISNEETFRLNSARLMDSFRLLGLWSLFGEWRVGTPYYVWARAYKTDIFVAIGFIAPFIAFIGLVRSRTDIRKILLFFTGLFCFGLFMVKGCYEPFGSLNLWISNNIPVLGTAFRATYQKWGLLLSFALSVIVGYGVYSLYRYVLLRMGRRFSQVIVALICLLIFAIQMFPFWNGQVIFEGGDIVQSARFKLPDSYYSFYNWTRRQPEEFRYFSLPLSKNSNAIYKWENSGYGGADFIRFFSEKPVVYGNYGRFYDIPLMIADKIEMRLNSDIIPLMALLNVKYILVHDDINWEVIKELGWWTNKNSNAVDEFVWDAKDLVLERRSECLRVYRLSDDRFIPYIFTVGSPILVEGSVKDLPHLAHKGILERKPLLLLMNGDIRGDSLPGHYSTYDAGAGSLSGKSISAIPEIVFRRDSPVKYQVSVSGAREPFWLVMSETYNSDWKVYRAGQGLASRLLKKKEVARYPDFKTSEAEHSNSFKPFDMAFIFKKALSLRHYVGNSYCNAWYIDPKDFGSEDFALEIFFWPQSIVYLFLSFSILFLFFCLAFFLVRFVRLRSGPQENTSTIG